MSMSVQPEVWIEKQTETYWVRFSCCKKKFEAGMIVNIFEPAFATHSSLQTMAEYILKNTEQHAVGTFNNKRAIVLLDNKVKKLQTPTSLFFFDAQGTIKHVFPHFQVY